MSPIYAQDVQNLSNNLGKISVILWPTTRSDYVNFFTKFQAALVTRRELAVGKFSSSNAHESAQIRYIFR